MKIAVIGGGSTYTPELVNGFLERAASLPLREFWLMDVDARRLEIVGGLAQRMVAAAGAPFQVILTTDRSAALRDARYVITQLRVGQMRARREDEYLGRRHGLIGQETTGVGGLAKALRTIPVILDIAGEVRTRAPGALLVNFTNPAGLVTEALNRYMPEVPAVGVCNVPFHMKMSILDLLGRRLGRAIAPARGELDTLGLNHLSWHRGFALDGEEIWPRVLDAYLDELRAAPEPAWEPALVESLRVIPNYYLQYYYATDYKLQQQTQWPPSRAEAVMALEAGLLRDYADPGMTAPPPELLKRGGAYYSTVATQLLNAHFNDLGETQVVNVRHAGAVPGWDPGWVLEMPARVRRQGIQPLPAAPLPPACYGLLAQVKMYELLTVEAAVHGDRDALYQALITHPLGPRPNRATAVMDDLLATHRTHLPRFWR